MGERVIYLKEGDRVATPDGYIEIIHYCGQDCWFVREMKNGEWAGDYTITVHQIQRKHFYASGKICCFFPERRKGNE